MILIICVIVVSEQNSFSQDKMSYWNTNIPLISHRLPPDSEGRASYIDFDLDGDPDALLTFTHNNTPVMWIDDDDDMKKGDIEGDTDSDCLIIDRDKDGRFKKGSELAVDWNDTDKDGKADMQVVADYEGRGHYMWVLDTDKDNIFNYLDWDNFRLRCWTHNGLSDFYEDYHGKSIFMKIHTTTDKMNDVRLNWENPFLFYDPDHDGLTEMAIRLVDSPDREKEQVATGMIDWASLSFDLDNDNHPGNEFDLDMTINFRGGGFNYMDQMHHFENMRGLPASDTLFVDPRWRQLTGLIYPDHETAWDLVFNRGKWDKVYFTYDEDDDCNRWERVEVYDSGNPFKTGAGHGGLDNNRQSDASGDRGEWDLDNSGRGNLYVSRFDGRIHLYGAEWGAWRIDQNAFSYQGFGGIYDGYGPSRNQVEPETFSTIKYSDTDNNGFFDMLEYDLNGDTLFEHTVSLKQLGIDDKCGIINTSEMKYEDFTALHKTITGNMWKNAKDAIEVAREAGINTQWYSLMMSPKSEYQEYSYGYWLQFYLYHDLLDWGYRRNDKKFIHELDRAYFQGNWKSLIRVNNLSMLTEDNQRQYFDAPRIVGKEDEFCRRAYRVMLKGAYFCKDLYWEWPEKPGCGFIGWGGHGEKDMYANLGFAHLYALLTSFGDYDEQITGVSREEAIRRVKGVIRYCCYSGIITRSSPWHRSSWSTLFSQMVWFIWPHLDEETREIAARIIVQDADRFIGENPLSGKIDDTKAESNAWCSRSLAIAIVMFPGHPHAPLWKEVCSQWMMNVFSTSQDKEDDTVVDGKRVNEWVITENINPDFTLENHKIVYPVYMEVSMENLALSGHYYISAGIDPPQATFHHMKDVYEVYKRLQTWEGLPAYINGCDKFLHLQTVDIIVHSFFAQVFKDPEASYLESLELDILEQMQARFTDGRLHPVEEVGIRSRIPDLSSHLGSGYLLHYVLQTAVKPVSGKKFDRRISGVTYYPFGEFILHRTPDKLVSFAWAKPHRVMGLAIPREGSWLVIPYKNGFTGSLTVEGNKDQNIEIKQLDKNIRDDSFTISAEALRCSGKVKHTWIFESLPDKDIVMHLKLTAREDIVLTSGETGTIGIGRELGSDEVILKSSHGIQAVAGPSDPEGKTFTFPDGKVNVGGRLSYQWSGTGTVCYQKIGYIKEFGAPEGYGQYQDLLYVRIDSGEYKAGQTIIEGDLRISMH
ncbi:MAG: hypothetical protein AB2L24_28415 [Mangrovibacterium sp.]